MEGQDPDALEGAPPPATKDDLRRRIQVAWAVLAATVAGLDDEALEKPGPNTWSAKDHLAHVATWERLVVAHLREGTEHELIAMGREQYVNADVEAINEAIHRLTKEWSVRQALQESEEAHQELLSLLAALTEGDLREPYWIDDPTGDSTMTKVAANTYLHFLEHGRWLKEMLRK